MKRFILFVLFIFSIPVYSKDIIWDQKGSPYTIKGCMDFNGDNLTINNAEIVFDNGCLNFSNGILKINDSVLHGNYNRPQNKIINIERSTLIIRHAELDLDHYISLSMSNVDIENLKSIDNNSNMLFFVNSGTNFFMSASQIENYNEALYFFGTRNIYLKKNLFKNNDNAIKIDSSKSVEINYNDFENNKTSLNINAIEVDANNNYFTGQNNVYGNFKVNSYSKDKNILDNICCSNIIFIPGIMSSRLYLGNNQLWEPNRNADVKKLFLDKLGNTIYKIYTRDIIDITNIFLSTPNIDKSLHKEFIDYLNGLKSQNYINDYKIIPYDWRITDELDLIEYIENSSKTSKTGKVTIITHSNGGLIAKYLVTELKRLNMSYMIDNIVFVAMPEYGTPQAITSLLYGHGQSILSGLILRSDIAKLLGLNMYTAYILLPSDKYFEFKNIDKNNIANSLSENINAYLYEKAKIFHQKIDNIIYPDNINIYQIVGYGLNTVYDIKKEDDKYIPLYNREGDGTVQDMKGLRYGSTTYINLYNTNFIHSNMMNNTEVISNINNILKIRNKLLYKGLSYNQNIKNISSSVLYISNLSDYPNMNIDSSKGNLILDDKSFIQSYGDNGNRFEPIDKGLLYVSDNKEILNLKSTKDEILNINYLDKKYVNIPIYKDISSSITLNNDLTLDLTLNETGKIIKFYDINSSTTTKDVITQIRESSISNIIKNRYINKIQKNDDIDNIKSYLKKVINNNIIKRKYSYLRSDYIHLYTLLLNR